VGLRGNLPARLSPPGANSRLSPPGANSRLSHPGANSRLSHPEANSRLSHPGANSRLSHPGANSRLSHPGAKWISHPGPAPREWAVSEALRSRFYSKLERHFSSMESASSGTCFDKAGAPHAQPLGNPQPSPQTVGIGFVQGALGSPRSEPSRPGRTAHGGRICSHARPAICYCLSLRPPGVRIPVSASDLARAVGMPARAHNFRLVCDAFAVSAAIL